MVEYQRLIGRKFVMGSVDCYDTIRSFFSDNFQLMFRNYARPDKFWDAGLDLYMENFRKEGFEAIDVHPRDVKVGDCWLMAIRSPIANHAGVYVGNGLMLHHFYGRLSTAELYKGVWRNTTVAHLRHKAVPTVTDSNQSLDIVSLLPPSLREKIQSVAGVATESAPHRV